MIEHKGKRIRALAADGFPKTKLRGEKPVRIAGSQESAAH